MVEHYTFNVVVEGSRPSARTKYFLKSKVGKNLEGPLQKVDSQFTSKEVMLYFNIKFRAWCNAKQTAAE